jgi:hypothetical protein
VGAAGLKFGAARLCCGGTDIGRAGIHQQRRFLLDFDVLPVLDQTDGPKQNRQRHGRAYFFFSLFAFGSAEPQPGIAYDQVLQSHVQLVGLAQHAGFLGVRNRPTALALHFPACPGRVEACVF